MPKTAAGTGSCGTDGGRQASHACDGSRPRLRPHDIPGTIATTGRDLICDGITEMGLTEQGRPQAGAFMLVNRAHLGETPADIDATLLRNGIPTIRGADVHAPDTHVRLTFGSNDEVVETLIRSLARAYRESVSPRS
ncbi:hypothetical protein [Embleya sp. NPDC020630]|uniref:hypothetical protein n=1 Tax=Embleya sp. NPDC020630 TaxID=3363979 RepID=UPI00379B5251